MAPLPERQHLTSAAAARQRDGIAISRPTAYVFGRDTYLESEDAMTDIRTMLDRLWDDYVTLNPRAGAIHGLLTARGEQVANDHIAFRTFDLPGIDAATLAAHFTARGYVHGGDYDIAAKKVTALHLEPPEAGLPKVFISQLRTGEFSSALQATVRDLESQIAVDAATSPEFLWSGVPWQPVTYATYEALRRESEYAAWVAAFGYRANHFTVAINALAFTQDIRALNAFLKAHGYVLNDSGGEVKGSPDLLLEQSSTMAEEVPVGFADGVRLVPACYYEFAKRYPGPDGRLFPGFIETSATRLFESTNEKRPA